MEKGQSFEANSSLIIILCDLYSVAYFEPCPSMMVLFSENIRRLLPQILSHF